MFGKKKNDGRPGVDEYFMTICDNIAKRSTCKRHNIGAVIVRDKQILATGYNGAPKGLPHCTDIGCIRDKLGIASGTHHEICAAVHAEQNAILQCAYHGISAKDATIYVNASPCRICAKMIINSGIKNVVYGGLQYPDDETFNLFKQAKVKIKKL